MLSCRVDRHLASAFGFTLTEADRHDKMLELAELLAEVLQKAVPSLNEQQVEEAGIYMAKNRDVFAKAFKSQPDALSELLVDSE